MDQHTGGRDKQTVQKTNHNENAQVGNKGKLTHSVTSTNTGGRESTRDTQAAFKDRKTTKTHELKTQNRGKTDTLCGLDSRQWPRTQQKTTPAEEKSG